MEKVDNKGKIIGFSILKVSALKGQQPISLSLKPVRHNKAMTSN